MAADLCILQHGRFIAHISTIF